MDFIFPEEKSNKVILVVDDDPDNLEILSLRLQKEGYSKILIAADGEEALKIFAEEKPELILLDIFLPDLSGLEVLKKIKETETLTAVILMTAYGSEEVAVNALREGADDYIIKPIRPAELQHRLQLVQQRYELRKHNTLLQSQLQTVLTCMPSGVIITDSEGLITHTNQKTEIFINKKLDAAEKKLLIWDYFEKPKELFEPLLTSENPLTASTDSLSSRLQGDLFQSGLELELANRFLKIQSAPLYGEKKALLGYVFMIQDVTDQKTLEKLKKETVERLTQRIEEDSKALEEITKRLLIPH